MLDRAASWPSDRVAHFVWEGGPPRSDFGHGNVCTHGCAPEGVGGTVGGGASRRGYQLGAKAGGLARPRGRGPALGAWA